MTSSAAALLEARREGVPLDGFPGGVPRDRQAGYAIQDEILQSNPGRPVGWKVAMVRADLRDRFGEDRIVGPIFAEGLQVAAAGETVSASVCDGGFGALEAEFAIKTGRDLNASDGPFDTEAIAAAVGAMHMGIEIASSPIADLNGLGPAAIAADHGGNGGGVLGPVIPQDGVRSVESKMTINGAVAGTGSSASVPGGPLAALAFLANHLAARGIDLPSGSIVLTGMTTGVHDVKPGDRAIVAFSGIGEIHVDVRAVSGI